MARQKGSANFSGTLEPLAGGALDARSIVQTKADLTASSSFPYFYIGMETYVVSENKKYRLVGNDPTVLANWEDATGGSQIDVDDAIDDTSENPVQNKVIAEALDEKADLIDGKIPASQLPSYVDDVIEGYYDSTTDRFYEESTFTTVIPPEAGKSWVDKSTNKSYRWTGSGYARVDEGVQLGETADTAYRGDRGKTAYDDSQTNKGAIGTLANLLTTAKNNLVAAINELFSGKQKNLTAGDSVKITTGSSSDTIDIKEMASTDMSEIVDPLPAIPPRLMQYSEEERVIGYWIDGKPIYQKTINFGALPNATTKAINHGISNLGYIVNTIGYAKSTSGTDNWYIPIPYPQPSAANKVNPSIGIWLDNSEITLATSVDRTDYSAYITIQYTKTTD